MSTAFALSNPRPGVSPAEPVLLRTRMAGDPAFLGYKRLAGDAPDGLVLSNGSPAARPVRAYHKDSGVLAGATVSASDGTWELPGLSPDVDFDVQFVATATGERDVLVPKVRAS